MRQLVTIQRVKAVRSIENADNIEVADILGWHVVVKKGEFKEGDLCVYGEIDTIFPADNKYFAFLEGKRIRTKKLRGQISQGIAFPLCILEGYDKPFGEGDDVTELLGAKKWEPQADPWYVVKEPKNNKWYMRFRIGRWFWRKFIYKPLRAEFPSWINKTDETRVQVLQDVLYQYKGTVCDVTEKLDGSSVTFWVDKKRKLHVCSRNKEILDEKDIMYVTAMKFYDSMKFVPFNTVFQGEIIGPKIQGNKYKLDDYRIYVFNIANKSGNYVPPAEMRNICRSLNIPTVPSVGCIKLTDDVDKLVELSIEKSVINKSVQREGIVIRPIENIIIPDHRFVGGRLSFKVINPKFLLKYEE